MKFMNESEIDELLHDYVTHPTAYIAEMPIYPRVTQRAVEILNNLRHLVNANSDGWAYWEAPVKSAYKLMVLLENPKMATHAALKAAVVPIKSFCTRKRDKFPPAELAKFVTSLSEENLR